VGRCSMGRSYRSFLFMRGAPTEADALSICGCHYNPRNMLPANSRRRAAPCGAKALPFEPELIDNCVGSRPGGIAMPKAHRMTATAAAIGIAALSLSTPALAGSSDVAGLVRFGIRAILGGPPKVYFATRRAYAHRAYPRTKRAKTAASSPAPRVAQKTDVKFKAAQAKAKRDGVHTLTQKDIEGLSLAQIKQIRGY
jgi:hypothetical protein